MALGVLSFARHARAANVTPPAALLFASLDRRDRHDPVESLQTQFTDDSYLKVILSTDRGALYVEVAGHDGEDHKDDGIAVAVLAKLR